VGYDVGFANHLASSFEAMERPRSESAKKRKPASRNNQSIMNNSGDEEKWEDSGSHNMSSKRRRTTKGKVKFSKYYSSDEGIYGESNDEDYVPD